MRTIALALLLSSSAAAAAAPRKCLQGNEPRLSGDAFAPVECSTAPAAALPLPGEPVAPAADAKAFLKKHAGRWEGVVIHGLGRYQVLLALKTGWGGKAELVLKAKEMQFRTRVEDALALVPSKPAGAYSARLTSDQAPAASLAGELRVGAAAEDGSRALELVFQNGASHRLSVRPTADGLAVSAASAIPGAPLQRLETTLVRSERDAL